MSGWLLHNSDGKALDKSFSLTLLCQLSTISEQQEGAKEDLDASMPDGSSMQFLMIISMNVINKPCFHPFKRM